MAARTIIEAERHDNLAAFEETFAKLEGVAGGEHLAALRRATTTTASRSRYPQSDDPLGQAAYTAAALRGLAEAVARYRGRQRSRRKQGKRANPFVVGGGHRKDREGTFPLVAPATSRL